MGGGTPGDDMAEVIREWVEREYGPAATVTRLEDLSGHSSVTVGFDVETGAGVERLVVKIPPAGVPPRGNYDVLRQVPVLLLLERQGLRAPVVRAYGRAGTWGFPVPFLVFERLPGKTPRDAFTGPWDAEPADIAAVCDEAAEFLARLHEVPIEDSELGQPRPLEQELDHWVPILGACSDSAWVSSGRALREHLLQGAPSTTHLGLVHGDFYPNNWLVDGPSLTGVVDWENAVIGVQELDVAWLCLMCDPDSWAAPRREWMTGLPTPESLLSSYVAHGGIAVGDHLWFRALAAYRMSCLTAYYVELHRTGKRHDPVWEVMALSFEAMIAAAHRNLVKAYGERSSRSDISA